MRNEDETGIPPALMDCTWITAQRTGAATALAAKYLARPDAKTLGILGCGVQGRSNLEALRLRFSLQRVFAYDTHIERAESYAREMQSRFGIEVQPVSQPREAPIATNIAVPPAPL